MRIFRQSPVRGLRDERGITGIETGVLLGALAAVSSLVAAVAINAGVSASHQLDASMSAAMRQVDGGLTEAGPMIVRTDGTKATAAVIPVRTLGGDPVALSDGHSSLVVRYINRDAVIEHVPFSVAINNGNADEQLDSAETADITADLSGIAAAPRAGERFTLMLITASGPPLTVDFTMPGGRPLDPVALLR